MGEAVLALDIGTSRTKVALYRESGQGPASGPEPVGAVFSAPTAGIDGRGTIDVAILVDALLELTRRALAEIRTSRPEVEVTAVGVTSFLSHVLLDEHGAVLGPGLSWSYRPSPEALQACAEACRDAGYQLERPLGSELLAPRLVHLARYQRDRARRVRRVVSLKDLVRARLAGGGVRTAGVETHVDWSFRDYSLLRDRMDRPVPPVLSLLVAEGYADPEALLPAAGPAHLAVNTVSPSAAKELGLPAEIPIALGSTDGTAAMYGGGVLAEGSIVAVLGTTDVVMRAIPAVPAASATPVTPGAAEGLSRNACIVPGYELIGGSTSASGATLQWMQDLLKDPEGWEHVPPGAQGLTVAPGFAGERAPWNHTTATGAIQGLTLAHRGAHVARALREAQIFRLRRLLEVTAQGMEPATVLAGGGNRTLALDALRTAMLPWPLQWRRDPELSLCGAAIFALASRGGDETARNEAVHRLCAGAAGDTEVPQETAPRNDGGYDTVYEDLYHRWCRWISRLYGAER